MQFLKPIHNLGEAALNASMLLEPATAFAKKYTTKNAIKAVNKALKTDAEWDALETDCLTYRISTIREEFVGYGLTDKADLGTLVNILFGERNALLYIPLLDVEIVERLAIDSGVGIVGTIDSLTA